MGIIKQHGIKFVTFLLEQDAKQWYRVYVKSQSLILPRQTYKPFHTLLLDKYVPQAPHDHKKYEFLALKQGDMSVAAYETKFHGLSLYTIAINF